MYCNKEWSGGNTLLRNSVGDEGRGGGAQTGGCLRVIVLIFVQRPQTKRISGLTLNPKLISWKRSLNRNSCCFVQVPGNVDVLIAGTSCVDYSNMNNKQKGIEEKGESGQVTRMRIRGYI